MKFASKTPPPKITAITRSHDGLKLKTTDNGHWRALYKDGMGYFVYIDKKIGLVDRLDNPKDLEKIEEWIKLIS